MPDFYGKNNDGKFWSDYKGNAPAVKNETREEEVVTKASGPMVQPFVIVPFAAPVQPLYQYPDAYIEDMPLDGDMYGYDNPDGYGYAEEEGIKREKAKGKANPFAIISMIVGLIAILFTVITNFVSLSAFDLVEGQTVLGAILDTVKSITGGEAAIGDMLFESGVIVALLFTVLTFIVSLFSMKKRYPIIGKIFAILAIVGVVLMVIAIFTKEMQLGFGAYAVAGLTAISSICAIAAKRK